MNSTATTRPKARKADAHGAARPVEQRDVTPDAPHAIHGDDPNPFSTVADEVTIADPPTPTDGELAEAHLIGWLEHEQEEERREAREAADANGWALHLNHLHDFDAQGREPAPAQHGGGVGEEAP